MYCINHACPDLSRRFHNYSGKITINAKVRIKFNDGIFSEPIYTNKGVR